MNTNQKFYQKNWFIYLCMLFFPPAGIILMWIFNKKSSVKFKGILTVIATAWFILLINSDTSTSTDNETIVSNDAFLITESNTIESEIFIEDTANISSESTDTTIETNSETITNIPSQPENIVTETDLEIITRAGHPTYYGSVASSHTIWDDLPKNKIIFGDKTGTFGDETILSMTAYRNSDLIRGIYIYFSNFESPANLTLEDVLPIVSSYMPYDVIDKYYQYEGSELFVPDDDNDSTQIKYYTFSYGLTDEGSAAYYEKKHEYSGSIDVIIDVNANGIVNSFSICFGKPRWMYSLELNSYHREIWECNLTDYTLQVSDQENSNVIQPESESESTSTATADNNDIEVPEPSTELASINNNTSSANNNFNTYDNVEQQQTTASYVLNTNTKKIHHPYCSSVSKIAPKNYATSSQTVEELISQGYSTCKRCF